MTLEVVLILGLLLLVVIETVAFIYVVNKLVNKIMSRNFPEYVQTTKKESFTPTSFKVQLPHEDDLGPLAEFTN